MNSKRLPKLRVSKIITVAGERAYLQLQQQPDDTWVLEVASCMLPLMRNIDHVLLFGTQGAPRRGFGGVFFKVYGTNEQGTLDMEATFDLSAVNQNNGKRGYICFERGINRRWRLLSSSSVPFDMTTIHGVELEYLKEIDENETPQAASKTAS